MTNILLLPCAGIGTSNDQPLLLGCDRMVHTRSCLVFWSEVEFSREQELWHLKEPDFCDAQKWMLWKTLELDTLWDTKNRCIEGFLLFLSLSNAKFFLCLEKKTISFSFLGNKQKTGEAEEFDGRHLEKCNVRYWCWFSVFAHVCKTKCGSGDPSRSYIWYKTNRNTCMCTVVFFLAMAASVYGDKSFNSAIRWNINNSKTGYIWFPHYGGDRMSHWGWGWVLSHCFWSL